LGSVTGNPSVADRREGVQEINRPMRRPAPKHLESMTETVTPQAATPERATGRDACLVQIYPTGPTMGRRYPLAGPPVVIGRGADCGIRIEDHSVSRRHTRIESVGAGHQAVDLDSTNGTLVNKVTVRQAALRDGDYLGVGNHIFRYLAGGNVEAEYHEEIYRLTIIDALTDVPNKRYLREFLDRELARAARYERPLSLILFDIDRFKSINDQHGHLCGDHVLRELAARLKPAVRAEELLARYGGEEFAVVLPETAAAEARVMAERLRGLVRGEPFHFDQQTLSVTISLGLATSTDGATTAGELIRRADEKLYEAKRTGRDRVAG
jgi:diguanylate cyclase (GGDEF)-like protein